AVAEDDARAAGVAIAAAPAFAAAAPAAPASSYWLRGFLSAPAAQGISVTLPAAAAAPVAAQPASLAASRPYWDGLGIAPQKAAPQAPGRSANWVTAFVTNLARPVEASPNASLRITLL
ncbi:MAG TPA: hypothetical protein PK752_14925, partial [Accumulibacter sp.]|nr:hypothetical protein [Accumulibacter sp.]